MVAGPSVSDANFGPNGAAFVEELVRENESLLLEVEQLRSAVTKEGLDQLHQLRQKNDTLQRMLGVAEARLKEREECQADALEPILRRLDDLKSAPPATHEKTRPGDQTSCAMAGEVLAVGAASAQDRERLQMDLRAAKEKLAAREKDVATARGVETTLWLEVERLTAALKSSEECLREEHLKKEDLLQCYRDELSNVAYLKNCLKEFGVEMSDVEKQMKRYKSMLHVSSFTNRDNEYAFRQTMDTQEKTLFDLKSELCATRCNMEDMKKYYEGRLANSENEKKNLSFRIRELEEQLHVAHCRLVLSKPPTPQ